MHVLAFSSVAQSCPALCDPINHSTSGLPVHQQLSDLPKLMSIESVMPFTYLTLCCPLLLLPSIPTSVKVFSNELTLLMRWPKYWSFSFSISPSKEHPGLISFRMDWLDLLAVQGTLKSLLQHLSSKASILWRSAFFMVQLAHLYKTAGRTQLRGQKTFSSFKGTTERSDRLNLKAMYRWSHYKYVPNALTALCSALGKVYCLQSSHQNIR